MRKRFGKSYTLYLPEQVMARAKVLADERERSTSQIVTTALKEYLNRPKPEAAEQGAQTPRTA